MEKAPVQREIEVLVENVVQEHNLDPYDIEIYYIVKEKYGNYLKEKYPKSDIEYWIEAAIKELL